MCGPRSAFWKSPAFSYFAQSMWSLQLLTLCILCLQVKVSESRAMWLFFCILSGIFASPAFFPFFLSVRAVPDFLVSHVGLSMYKPSSLFAHFCSEEQCFSSGPHNQGSQLFLSFLVLFICCYIQLIFPAWSWFLEFTLPILISAFFFYSYFYSWNHRITEWFWHLKVIQSNLHFRGKGHPAWFWTLPGFGASTTSLVNLFQCLTALTTNNLFLIHNLNLPSFSLNLYSLSCHYRPW